MKFNIVLYLLLLSVFSACKKEYASFGSYGNYSNIQPSIESLNVNELEITPLTSLDKKNIPFKNEIRYNKIAPTNNTKNTKAFTIEKNIGNIISDFDDDKKKIAKEKKERNPKLSRALWLLIPGGLAVILGILLYGVAPTGLFIFAFSIVFLVGLISLIQYWINPKPKS